MSSAALLFVVDDRLAATGRADYEYEIPLSAGDLVWVMDHDAPTDPSSPLFRVVCDLCLQVRGGHYFLSWWPSEGEDEPAARCSKCGAAFLHLGPHQVSWPTSTAVS